MQIFGEKILVFVVFFRKFADRITSIIYKTWNYDKF